MQRSRSRRHEIERKFLIESLPQGMDLSSVGRKNIVQSYLIVTDNEELRVRREGDSYSLTLKRGKGLAREEAEVGIDRTQFDTLWAATTGRQIEKDRYVVHSGGRKMEIDLYRGRLEGLAIAEIEFKTKKEAREFAPPFWLKEVTGKEDYRNSALALQNRYTGPVQSWVADALAGWKKRQPELQLNEGVDELVKRIYGLASERVGPVVVLIAGGSASGKTSRVASRILERMGPKAVLISIDDYNRGATYVKANNINFDHPDSVDLELVAKHLGELRADRPVDKPVYDFKASERAADTVLVEPRGIIIVEGLFALNKRLAPLGDVKVFVDAGLHGRTIRRLVRDSERTIWSPLENIRYMTSIVEPMYREHVEPTKGAADLIIRNDYNPAIESRYVGMKENQVKYRFGDAIQLEEMLRKGGARRIASVRQTDNYLMSRDHPFEETGEVIRIRAEGAHKVFTYKGPKDVEGGSVQRQVFSFEIDDDTEKAIYAMYPTIERVMVSKDRTVFLYNGMAVYVDAAIAREEEDKGGVRMVYHLGNFVEFTLPEGQREVGKDALERLGLGQAKAVGQPYSTMEINK